MELFIFLIIIVVLLIVVAPIVGIIFLVKVLSNKKAKTSSNVTRSQSKECPPIPSAKTSKESSELGIMRIRFDSTQMGLKTAEREQNMLESSERAADEWVRDNPAVEIMSITSTMGGMNASVTIWYKQHESKQRTNQSKDPTR